MGSAPPEWKVIAGSPAHVRLFEVEPFLREAGLEERVVLPWLAHVRNPWDWYVSLYFFMEQHYRRRTGGFCPPRGQWSAGCRAWHETYSHGNGVEGFRKALPVMLTLLHDEADERVVPHQAVFLRSEGPLPCASGELRVIRFEDLRDGTVAAIEATGASVQGPARSQILHGHKTNTSGHAPYTDCYDEETKKLVDRYEGWVIDRFEYRFGG